VWNAKDGGEVGKEMVHGERVHAIVVSRDGKTMASGGCDGIVVWSLESREKIIEWKNRRACGPSPCHKTHTHSSADIAMAPSCMERIDRRSHCWAIQTSRWWHSCFVVLCG
jgi:hypothetical protein